MIWEEEGWEQWDYTEQRLCESDGGQRLLFTTRARGRQLPEEEERERLLAEVTEEGPHVATPKRKRGEEEEGTTVGGGAGVEGTPEKRRCLERKVGGGGSPDLRRLMAGKTNPRPRMGFLEEEQCKEGGGRIPGRGTKEERQEEEQCGTMGATEQPNPASSTRKLGWLKPPTETQNPRRKRQPRRSKKPPDVTQRTIKIARRRKQGGGDGAGGEEENLGGGGGE